MTVCHDMPLQMMRDVPSLTRLNLTLKSERGYILKAAK